MREGRTITQKNVREVCTFHGLTSFYRRFLKYLSTIVSPPQIMNEFPFMWGEK